jgi:hypothetical protein
MVGNSTRARAAAARKRRTATIAGLYSELKTAREAAHAIPKDAQAAAFDRAAARLGRVAARIASAPADSLDEAAVKIEAVMQEGDYNDALDCLASLRKDLRRIRARN